MARFAIADLVTCMGAEKARQITEKFIEEEQRHANLVLRGPGQAVTVP
jgi:rubrerythrin